MEPKKKLKHSRVPHMQAPVSGADAKIINNDEILSRPADVPVREEASASAADTASVVHSVKRARPTGARRTIPMTPVAQKSPVVPEATVTPEATVVSKAQAAPKAPAKQADHLSEYTSGETRVFDAIDPAPAQNGNKSFHSDSAAPEQAFAFPCDEFDEETGFDVSLDQLSPDDIDPNGSDRRAPFPVFAIARVLLILICLGIFAYCAFIIGRSIIDYGRTDVIYGNLAEEFFSLDNSGSSDGSSRLTQVSVDASVPTADGATDGFVQGGGYVYTPAFTSEDNPFDTNPTKMIQNLTALKERAPDLYGWIYIEGTRINYPIVQTTDNNYYLNHSADKLTLQTGAIFADFRCFPEVMRNFNTVLYGHNIRSGAMFHDVEKFYKNQDVFNNTRVIVCTFTGVYYYEPFAVFHATYDSGYNETGFPSGADFISFAQSWQNNSVFSKNMSFKDNDRVLTLSTCTNGASTERYALMCKLADYDFPATFG